MKSSFHRFCLFLALAVSALAQPSMTVTQLVEFVSSSVKLHEDDRKLAEMVKKVRLTNQESGAGRLTVAALKTLMADSASLPPAPAPKVSAAPAPAPAASPMAAPDAEQQKEVLAAVTENALNYSDSLPNFICLQVTQRYVDRTGGDHFVAADKIAERLSYFDHKEDYKVISVNDTPVTNRKHEQLGGATSSGEFGTMLREIFAPQSQTEFQWERWGKLRAHIMHVFSFRVRLENSQYQITAEEVKRTVTVGYHGLIYADRDSHAVTRITMEADDIPADFPIRAASETLDYDTRSISGQSFLLPIKVEMRMRDAKSAMKNEAEFRLYNKFGADASITFDAPDAATPEPKAPDPPGK
jgi:hypothetical protein